MKHTRTAFMLALLSLGCAGGAEEGRYANATGDFALELRGGKAHMSMGIVTESSPYRVQGDKIVIDWDGDKVVLTREKDGSLSGPSGTMFARLFRKK